MYILGIFTFIVLLLFSWLKDDTNLNAFKCNSVPEDLKYDFRPIDPARSLEELLKRGLGMWLSPFETLFAFNVRVLRWSILEKFLFLSSLWHLDTQKIRPYASWYSSCLTAVELLDETLEKWNEFHEKWISTCRTQHQVHKYLNFAVKSPESSVANLKITKFS